MLQIVFEIVRIHFLGKSIIFCLEDVVNKERIFPVVRMIGALCILVFAKGYNEMDELCILSKASVREIIIAFVEKFLALFGGEYLHKPRAEDFARSSELTKFMGSSALLAAGIVNAGNGRTF